MDLQSVIQLVFNAAKHLTRGRGMTPAEVVIGLFGVRPLARYLDIAPGTVIAWRGNGLIPSEYHRRLLELARERKKRLTPTMLIMGRPMPAKVAA